MNVSRKALWLILILVCTTSNVSADEIYRPVREWGAFGHSAGQFDGAQWIAVDRHRIVYVSDQGNDRVQRFTANGRVVSLFGATTGPAPTTFPAGVAVDTTGHLALAAGTSFPIVRKSLVDGQSPIYWGSAGEDTSQFQVLSGVAFGAGGSIYAADYPFVGLRLSPQGAAKHRIQRFSATGVFMSQWGTFGSGAGDFDSPTGIATDASGNVYVCDRGNNRIQKFSSTGSFVSSLAIPSPFGIALDKDGNMYVSSGACDCVTKFSSAGAVMATFGSSGSDFGQLSAPAGVAVDDSGTVYVADAGNNRVQVFSRKPHVLLVHGLCGSASDWSLFADILGDSGYVVHTVQLGPTTYSTTPQQQLLGLTAAIKALHTDNLAVISHSMGGVVTRSYMKRQVRLGQPNPVSTLITLGTPHHGSDFVSYALSVRARLYQGLIGLALRDTYDSLFTKAVPCLGDARSTDALIDMSPGSEYLNKLNYGAVVANYDKGIFGSNAYVNGWSSHVAETGLRPETYYATVAGTRTACQWLDGPTWGIGPFAHRNDGVIAIESARLTNTTTMRALDVELPTRMLTHAHTAFLCGDEYRSLDTLAWKLKTIMQDHPPGPPVSNDKTAAPSVTSITAVAEDSLQLRPAILDNVAAGGMRDIPVTVLPSSRLYVTLYSRDAVLSLFTPLAVPITAADTSSTVHHMGETGSGHDGFVIGNPAPGTWTIHVDCTASGSSQRTAAIVGVTSSYAASMWGASDVVAPGDSVTVRATLLLAGTPQTGVTWTCKAIRPDSTSGTVVLFDDGVHGDSLSGDGIYGARVGTSAGTGTYWMLGRASIGGSGEFGARMAFVARQPHDVYIGAGDLQMIKNVAGVSDSVLLLVTVRNAGIDAAFDVDVSVSDKRFGVVMYDGEVDIPANGATVISVPWRVDLPDTHTVVVVVSPYVFEYESNYDNNVLERQLVLGEPLSVDPSHEGLGRLVMLAPRPNPGVQGAVLEFVLPRSGAATLDVFDVLGRRVRGWSWATLQAGAQRVTWDGRDVAGNAVPPGVFLCRLQAGGMVGTQKLIVRP